MVWSPVFWWLSWAYPYRGGLLTYLVSNRGAGRPYSFLVGSSVAQVCTHLFFVLIAFLLFLMFYKSDRTSQFNRLNCEPAGRTVFMQNRCQTGRTCCPPGEPKNWCRFSIPTRFDLGKSEPFDVDPAINEGRCVRNEKEKPLRV